MWWSKHCVVYQLFRTSEHLHSFKQIHSEKRKLFLLGIVICSSDYCFIYSSMLQQRWSYLLNSVKLIYNKESKTSHQLNRADVPWQGAAIKYIFENEIFIWNIRQQDHLNEMPDKEMPVIIFIYKKYLILLNHFSWHFFFVIREKMNITEHLCVHTWLRNPCHFWIYLILWKCVAMEHHSLQQGGGDAGPKHQRPQQRAMSLERHPVGAIWTTANMW